MPPLRVLELAGSHYEMGYQHGLAFYQAIHEITAERVHLCSDSAWTGRNLSQKRVLELAQECLTYHQDYAPELIEQLHGMRAATGLSLPELLIANGFTDFADVVYNALDNEAPNPIYGNECTTWLSPAHASADGIATLAQTWDMHATATPYVVMLKGKPKHEPEFLAFTLTGCLAMIGMNSAGIAVGINNLASIDGQAGVLWTFVCRKILMQETLEDALACITEAHLAGGHNYLLLDKDGRGYNVEAMPTRTVITPLENDALVHANTCLFPETQAVQRPLSSEWYDDSRLRISRAQGFLNAPQLTPDDMMDITRNREDGRFSICSLPTAPFYSETCGAVVMRPTTGDFWGVWGLPTENPYEHFQLETLESRSQQAKSA